METNNVCNDHLVPIGWGGKLNGCPVCFLEEKLDAQAEQLTAKDKEIDRKHRIIIELNQRIEIRNTANDLMKGE